MNFKEFLVLLLATLNGMWEILKDLSLVYREFAFCLTLILDYKFLSYHNFESSELNLSRSVNLSRKFPFVAKFILYRMRPLLIVLK